MVNRRRMDRIGRMEHDVAGVISADEPATAMLARELERFLRDQPRRHHVRVECGFGFRGAEPRGEGLRGEGGFEVAAY